jgi:magnesium transporter
MKNMKGHPDEEIEPYLASGNKIILELIQYNEQEFAKYDDLKCDDLLSRLKDNQVNWINLDGLEDRSILKKLAKHFDISPLLLEDITSESQPKVEEFDGYLFVTMKMLYRIDVGKIIYEQMSFVLGKDYLITFQEKEGDSFGPFRERIRLSLGQVRKKKADYLLYRLIDIIVDNYYTILDNIGQRIESTEDEVYNRPTEKEFEKIQKIKKELIFLRKALYPLRDSVGKLTKGESEFLLDENSHYFQDVYDHIVQLISTLDTYRDLTTGLMDVHINTINTRMTEVMKVLAIFSAIFMPLTFIAGVYGMNFEKMPEIKWAYGYPFALALMAMVGYGLVRYFRYKKWM